MGHATIHPQIGSGVLRRAGVLVFCALACVASAQPSAVAPPPRAKWNVPVEKLTAEQLIDALREESEQGIGTHATARAGGFIGDDEPPRFEGGILGSQRPVTSPAMRELVRRGLAALPKLLEHLDDKRSTWLVVGGENRGFITAIWHADEYDARHRDPKKKPEKVNTDIDFFKRKHVEEYALRVGDLCYVAVGQIVNRRLNVLRYQPTACLVINSPAETPALAVAVRKDWADLTVEQHKQSLIRDAFYMDWGDYEVAAVRRLLFYHPKAGEDLAAKLLARPIVNKGPAWDFKQKLVAEKDATKWAGMVAEFRREHGDALADTVPTALWWHTRDKPAAEIERAEKITAGAYPGYDLYNPPFVNAVELRNQLELIRGLDDVRFGGRERAFLDGFRVGARADSAVDVTRHNLDRLACEYISRLAGRGYDDEFRAFLAVRIKTLKAKDESLYERKSLDLLGKWQERLGK